ncbi:MAG: hypoxanthine phosphoribosyltransferase [Acidobacteria bacterium]|nr:hypoxanthine phosphoribosyltransferase [Acidobacteriota bacterium]
MTGRNGAVLDADQYLADSFRLARSIWDDGLRPDFMVALWRGGAPPGIAIQEYFRWRGHDFYHTAIRTQSMEGLEKAGGFDIRGLEHVIDNVDADHSLLIVDNLFETGRTVFEVVEHLRRRARRNMPRVQVATVYFTPSKRQFLVGPDYWLHEVEDVPVFPHELGAMQPDAVRDVDPALHAALWGQAEESEA